MTRELRTPGQLCDALGIAFSDQQLRAITAPLQPAVLIAGAGSGKTTVMAARVVWLVGSGQVAAGGVLGLTFTRKAAAELSTRVRRALTVAGVLDRDGADDAGEQLVMTYDAFAGRLVGEYGLRLGIEGDPRLLTGASRFRLASRVVANAAGPFEHLSRLRPETVTQRILALDGDLQTHLVGRADLDAHTRRLLIDLDSAPRNRQRNVYASLRAARAAAEERLELVALAQAYAELKTELGYLEFADQMAIAARLAQEIPEVSAALRSRFQVVLLDEYQDTSSAQAALLSGLFSGASRAEGRGHPVTAVGDPCQAIYGWRGAASSNILQFAGAFPTSDGLPAARYPLTVNRRSGQRILDAANDLAVAVRKDPGFGGDDLDLVAPEGVPPGGIRAASFDTWEEEVTFIADDIVAAHATAEVPAWSEIAVLTRRNAHIAQLYAELTGRGVPAEIVGLGGLLDLPEVAEVVAVLSVLNDVTANGALVRLLTGPRWAIGPADLVALGRRAADLAGGAAAPDSHELWSDLERAVAHTDSANVVSLLEAVENPGEAPLSDSARRRLTAFAAELGRLREHAGEPVLDLVRRVITSLGLEAELAAAATTGRPSAQLDAFVAAVSAYTDVDGDASLSGLLAYLDAERRQGTGLDQATVSIADSVKLLTVHKAKGLEWDRVYVPALAADVFPSDRVTGNWMKRADVVPADLRGDADSVPQLAEVTDQAATAYAAELTVEARRAEDRLAYVAVTRARQKLIVSTHTWWPDLIRPRRASDYFTLVAAHAEVIATAPPPGDSNPLISPVRAVAWPTELDPDVMAERRRLAGRVREARAVHADTGEYPEVLPATLDEAETITRWDTAIDRLLAEAGETAQPARLPDHLSATGVVRAYRRPEAFLAELGRPLPRMPRAAETVGVLFHQWLERRFATSPLLGEEFEVEQSSGDHTLDELCARFESGPFADLVPIAVEAPFSTVLGDRLVRGRIDAVYDTPDDDTDYLVVDWKTGSADSADPLQLAIYRLAWAELHGIEPARVRAGFYDVPAGRLVHPTGLPDRPELEALVAEAIPGG